ncbi:MAG: hypothetical protein ACI4MC_03555 [Candidatus Coproplasma sp.]
MILVFLPTLIGGGIIAFGADGEAELTDNIESIIGGLDLGELQSYLDSYGNDYVYSFSKSAKGLIEFLLNGDLGVNYTEYLKKLFTSLFDGITNLLPAFAQVVAVTILCTITADAEGGIISRSTATVIRLACISVILLILSSMLVGVVAKTVECVNSISRQIDILTPILVTLTVLTGGSASGAIYTPCATFLGQGAIYLVNGVIIPVTLAVMILNFISRINPDISFSGISSLLKSVMKWIIGITVAVFGLFITVQSTSTSLFNGIFFKVTKYLVGNSVPIVGNFLSSGVDMIVLSGAVVKSSVGLTGIVLLISSVLEPVISLIAFSLMLKISGAIAQSIGEKTSFSLYNDLSKDIEFMIAGVLIVAFMYLLTIMLIINSTYAFI